MPRKKGAQKSTIEEVEGIYDKAKTYILFRFCQEGWPRNFISL